MSEDDPESYFIPSQTHCVEENELIHSHTKKNSTIVVLSPHLDDAVLSMGATLCSLASSKKHIIVLNVFTKGSTLISPLTKSLLSKAQVTTPEEYFEKRKIEDAIALHKLGNISIENLDFTDGPWRSHNDKPLYRKMIGSSIHGNDLVLAQDIEKRISNILITLKNPIVFAPLAIGWHVDHVIVRAVAGLLESDVTYYTDYPYCVRYKSRLSYIEEKNLAELMTKKICQNKKAAILAYRTQYKSLFQTGPLQVAHESFYVPRATEDNTFLRLATNNSVDSSEDVVGF